jgi:hypothetical protein
VELGITATFLFLFLSSYLPAKGRCLNILCWDHKIVITLVNREFHCSQREECALLLLLRMSLSPSIVWTGRKACDSNWILSRIVTYRAYCTRWTVITSELNNGWRCTSELLISGILVSSQFPMCPPLPPLFWIIYIMNYIENDAYKSWERPPVSNLIVFKGREFVFWFVLFCFVYIYIFIYIYIISWGLKVGVQLTLLVNVKSLCLTKYHVMKMYPLLN